MSFYLEKFCHKSSKLAKRKSNFHLSFPREIKKRKRKIECCLCEKFANSFLREIFCHFSQLWMYFKVFSRSIVLLFFFSRVIYSLFEDLVLSIHVKLERFFKTIYKFDITIDLDILDSPGIYSPRCRIGLSRIREISRGKLFVPIGKKI